jgi:hypothetical protein
MWSWLKEKGLEILVFVEFITIIILVGVVLSGGIHLTNSSESISNSTSYANSSSSSIGINVVDTHYTGSNEKATYWVKDFTSRTEALAFYNSLNEGNLYNSQLFCVDGVWSIKYRDTNTNSSKITGSVSTATINGKVVVNNKSLSDIINQFMLKIRNYIKVGKK